MTGFMEFTSVIRWFVDRDMCDSNVPSVSSNVCGKNTDHEAMLTSIAPDVRVMDTAGPPSLVAERPRDNGCAAGEHNDEKDEEEEDEEEAEAVFDERRRLEPREDKVDDFPSGEEYENDDDDEEEDDDDDDDDSEGDCEGMEADSASSDCSSVRLVDKMHKGAPLTIAFPILLLMLLLPLLLALTLMFSQASLACIVRWGVCTSMFWIV